MRSAATHKRSASTALARTHNPVGADPRAGGGPFPKPRALVLPMVKFGQAKPDGPLIQLTATSCNINTVSLFFSGIQARRAGTPPISLRRPVEGSMRLFFKKASDHVPHISYQFIALLATRTLLSCSTRTPLSLTRWCLPSGKTPQAKVRGVVLLIVRGLLRRPSLSGTPTVTFCSVHIHNVVAKKRDASTDPLQRLHEAAQR